MTNNKPTISVVIPAHNEEMHIKACIDSLLEQNAPVDEIIVISNCSNDATVKIASSFPKVKVVELSQKGLINARNYGFNISKCDIIARLNADVVCSPNWSQRLLESFSVPNISAVAGVSKTATLPFWPYFYTPFWSMVYLLFAESYFGVPILWGANMAIRKEAWETISKHACIDDLAVHEDQDLSIHLAHLNKLVVKDHKLMVTTQEMSYFNWRKLNYYNSLRLKTKASHLKLIKNCDVKFSYPFRVYKFISALLPAVIFYTSSFMSLIIAIILRKNKNH